MQQRVNTTGVKGLVQYNKQKYKTPHRNKTATKSTDFSTLVSLKSPQNHLPNDEHAETSRQGKTI